MARFGIVRMMKFKAGDVQGIQKHNQRQSKISSNHDIDFSRSHLNYDLLNDGNIKYESAIKAKIAEKVKRKPRENSVVLSEFLVTASPEYLETLSAEEQARYFKTSLDFISERYGRENTMYAVVHMDEKTPHMHVGVIPLTEDGRLSAKDIYTKNELKALQDDFFDVLRRSSFDVERGQASDRKNVPVHEFKVKKDLEKEIEQLNQVAAATKENLRTLENERNKLQTENKKHREVVDRVKKEIAGTIAETVDKVDEIEKILEKAVEKKPIFGKEITVELPKDDFEKLSGHAKASGYYQSKAREYSRKGIQILESKKELQKENVQLMQSLKQEKTEKKLLEQDFKEVLEDLGEKNRFLEAFNLLEKFKQFKEWLKQQREKREQEKQQKQEKPNAEHMGKADWDKQIAERKAQAQLEGKNTPRKNRGRGMER